MQQLFLSFLLLSLISVNISCSSRSGNRKKFADGEKYKQCRVISVIDGDTFDVLLEGNVKVRIRMEGIDAPERGMPFYKAAKKYLSELCVDKYVRLETKGKDSGGRIIAFSYLTDGRELSHEMLKAGFAWHFKKYNSDSDLAELEKNARTNRIGLWVDESPKPPWEIRKLHRKGVSAKSLFRAS